MSTPGILLGFDLASGAPVDALPAADRCWVHLNRIDEGVKQWTREEAGIPEHAARALLAEETRPRVERINGGTLLNLRGANLNPDVEEQTLVLRAWIEGDRLVTYEKHPIYAVRDIHQRLTEKGGEHAPVEIVSRIVVRLIERLEPMVDDLDERLYVLEDQTLDPDVVVDRRELAMLQRQIISLRRYLAPQREAMLKLASGEGLSADKPDLIRLREAANHLSRLLEDLNAAYERAQAAQAEAAAQLEESQNKRLYAFTLVTIIFLPLSFLTGVFGMNVGGLPWTENAQGFLLVSSLMAVLGVGAALWMVWRKWV